jgi:hypothetical protein
MMNARGSRVRKRVFRVLFALRDRDWTTGELIRMTWPRKSRFDTAEYRRVRAAPAELAEVVGYQPRGRNSTEPGGLLWRLKSDGR